MLRVADEPKVGSTPSRRARGRALGAMLVALCAGLGASWMIARSIARRAPRVVSIPTRKVAVVKSDLPLATTLRADMIELVDWPAGAAPAGSSDEPQQLEGRVVRSAMVRGEPLVESRLAPPGGGLGLAAIIPGGMRAMTVRVNEASGVAGFIHPGDLVDVIATMAPHADTTELRSRVVLQRVKVIAVGDELVADSARPLKVAVVTLLVNAPQSERLALAATQGQLQLSMRAPIDGQDETTPGISAPDLYDEHKVQAMAVTRRAAAPAPQPAVAPSLPFTPSSEVVEIIRGNRSEERRVRTTSGDP